MNKNTTVRKVNYDPILPDFGPFNEMVQNLLSSTNEQEQYSFELLLNFFKSDTFLNIFKWYVNGGFLDNELKPFIQYLIECLNSLK